MANPIPIRSWSRLVSLRSSPAPESNPNKPHTHAHTDTHAHTAEPSSLKATNTFSNGNNTKSLPTSSNVHNPMHSQSLRLTTLMTFPPAKLKVHPQPGVELTIEKPNVKGNDNGSMMNESGETQKQGYHDPNGKQVTNYKEKETKGNGVVDSKPWGSEGHDKSVITISGENRGAYMQITHSQKKQPIHKMGNSDGKKVRTLSSPPRRALYRNSNVQCVNNSMLFHTSLTHHDPGMHLIVTKKQFGEGLNNLKERVGGQHN